MRRSSSAAATYTCTCRPRERSTRARARELELEHTYACTQTSTSSVHVASTRTCTRRRRSRARELECSSCGSRGLELAIALAMVCVYVARARPRAHAVPVRTCARGGRSGQEECTRRKIERLRGTAAEPRTRPQQEAEGLGVDVGFCAQTSTRKSVRMTEEIGLDRLAVQERAEQSERTLRLGPRHLQSIESQKK
jgi:hypothetical protein